MYVSIIQMDLALLKKKKKEKIQSIRKFKSSGVYTIKKGINIASNLYDNYVACGTTAN